MSDQLDTAATGVRDRATRALRELDAMARDCFGADKSEAALAAVSKAAGVRLVLSFIEDATADARCEAATKPPCPMHGCTGQVHGGPSTIPANVADPSYKSGETA